jgi:hypothetical protein
MEHRTHWRLWAGVAAAAVLIAAAMCAWVVFSRLPASGTLELAAARARWERRTFNAYAMRLSGHEGLMLCSQSEYTVRDEQIVQPVNAPPKGCGTFTVTDLFQRVADFEPKCGPNGCACDGAEAMTVTYDPTLGYPTSIDTHVDPALRVRYPGYWLGALPFVGRRGCTAIGYVRSEIIVLDLTPLE